MRLRRAREERKQGMIHRSVVVKTNGGEGDYVVSADGASCFATLLKALGYTAEIEELGKEPDSSDEVF